MFVHESQGMHLIGVAEHLGVRLPPSRPPWASTSRWTEAEKCCKNAANLSSSPPPSRPNKVRHAQLHCAYPSLLRNGNVLKRRDELFLKHFHCARDFNLSLREHSDVHNRKNCTCGTSKHPKADVMCIVTSKTSRVLPPVSTTRPSTKGTQRGVQRNQQNSPAHAIAEEDDERRTVLNVHTNQDAKHLEHADHRKEYSVNIVITSKTSQRCHCSSRQ